jgi:hypothetical protein
MTPENIMADLALGKTAGTVTAGTDLPGCGLASGTRVMTLKGEMAVEYIAPGDKIITRAGARTVTAVEIAVVRNARMIRICEGVLGKDRPEADTLVTPEQPILIRDWRAKAMTGVEQAVMAAARLADGEYIRAETVAEARIFTLRFADAQVIYAAGLELGCQPELADA